MLYEAEGGRRSVSKASKKEIKFENYYVFFLVPNTNQCLPVKMKPKNDRNYHFLGFKIGGDKSTKFESIERPVAVARSSSTQERGSKNGKKSEIRRSLKLLRNRTGNH